MKGRPEPAPPPLPIALAEALGECEYLDGVDVLDAWRWDVKERCWTLRCRLSLEVPGASAVPRRSDWVVLVEATYPWGYIHVQPAARNGVDVTFPHQNLNRPFSPARAWRTGRICVDNGVRSLGRQGVDREPYTVRDRLRWRLERALAWLTAAARGELVRAGDPFELPDLETLPAPLVAFGENDASLTTWAGEAAQAGVASLVEVREKPPVLAVLSYRDHKGREVYAPRWGTFISDPERPRTWAGWIRFKETPSLDPWRAPMTWGELRDAASRQGIELDALLHLALEGMRDGLSHLLLVGFPIPAEVGGAAASYFWQAIQLNPLASAVAYDQRGFRPGRAPRPELPRLAPFRNEAPIRWLRTENWHATTIAARGRLPEVLTTADVLVIGAGALGSAVAELLVRGGVERLTVCDDDLVMAGNLVRHSLTLDDIGRFKATALAERLNAVSPHAVVQAIPHAFPPEQEKFQSMLRPIDVVIDCTGENAVAHAMATYPWTGHKLFASVSLGLRAWAGFSYISFSESFPFDAFLCTLQPWLNRQAEQYAGTEWPREGVGCWHPVFPARIDEVSLLAAAAVQHLVDTVTHDIERSELAIFERRTDDAGSFTGLSRAVGAPDA